MRKKDICIAIALGLLAVVAALVQHRGATHAESGAMANWDRVVGVDLDLRSIDADDTGPSDSKVTLDEEISFYVGEGSPVVLSWADSRLDLLGDPNSYTEAARLFLTHILPDAAYQMVAADPVKVRRLVSEGVVCEAVGHQWETVATIDNAMWYYQERRCTLCGKMETRRMTEWK